MRKKLISSIGLLFLLSLANSAQAITTTTCPGAGCIDFNVGGQGSLGIQITGTWSGTITFQGSVNNTTFVSITAILSTDTSSALVSTTTANGIYNATVAGLSTVRIVFTSWVSGTADVSLRTAQSARKGTGSAVSGGNAPANATYITQTANSGLSAEQAIGALSSGVLRGATTTGVVTSLGDINGVANCVLFNDAGVFGCDAGLTYAKTTDILTSGRAVLSGAGAADILSLTQADETPYLISLTNTVSAVTTGIWVGDNGLLHLDLAAGIDVESSVDNSHSFNGFIANAFNFDLIQTDLAASDVVENMSVTASYGTGGVASIGTFQNFTTYAAIKGSGSASNEYGSHVNALVMQIGTGYTQTTGPTGRLWLADWGVQGPIAVQPNTLNGLVIANNNYYNGDAADSPIGALWITTNKTAGPGMDPAHSTATTYPQAVGIGITGTSGTTANGNTTGWTVALQIGGTGSPWNETKSLIGTAIKATNITSATTTDIRADEATAFNSIECADDGDDATDCWTRNITTAGILNFINNSNTNMILDTAGDVTFRGLATTGAATGKTLVCADTNGKLYRSSSGVACAN